MDIRPAMPIAPIYQTKGSMPPMRRSKTKRPVAAVRRSETKAPVWSLGFYGRSAVGRAAVAAVCRLSVGVGRQFLYGDAAEEGLLSGAVSRDV